MTWRACGLAIVVAANCGRTAPAADVSISPPVDQVFATANVLLALSLREQPSSKDEVAISLIKIVCAHDPTIDKSAAAAVVAAPLRDAYPPFERAPMPTALACGRFFIDSQEYAGKALQQYRLQHPHITPQPMPPRLPPIDETIVPPPPP